MKSIYLMTLYHSQPCITDAEPYIMIRQVHCQKEYRLSLTYGNVNFTDYWLETVKALADLKKKYIGQNFSLLSDENSEDGCNDFWNSNLEKRVVISLIKIRADIDGLGRKDAKELILANLSEEEKIDAKIFLTLDNADFILFLFCDQENILESVLDKIKNIQYNGEIIYYSYYFLLGKLLKVPESQEYKLKIEGFKNAQKLYQHPNQGPTEGQWCTKTMQELEGKMRKCMKERNKKWLSYYQTLYQLVNLLGQYEEEIKYKDLYYILCPPIELFMEQLNAGEENIRKNPKKKYRLMKKIEAATSDFIDSMETLIYHIGVSCSNILDIDGRNGLPYDISIRLCMLYVSALHAITESLNDTNYRYKFCLSPLAYSRPRTNVFDFGLEPGDRLVRIQIARQQMLSPRALLAILAHEGSHYIGEFRRREEREKYFVSIAAIILTEALLPRALVDGLVIRFSLKKAEKKIFLKDCRERKKKLLKMIIEQVSLELEKRNKSGEISCYFAAELYENVCKIIKENILSDPQGKLTILMDTVSNDLKMELLETNNLSDAYRKEIEEFQNNLKRFEIYEGILDDLLKIQKNLKEIVADLGAIFLLDMDPYYYLETYLLSESCELENETVNSMLINRIALVALTMFRNQDWKDKWDRMLETEGLNPYLCHLKERTDEYIQSFNKSCSPIRKKNDNEEKRENIKNNDPFCIKNIISIEKEYFDICYRELEKRIMAPKVREPQILLQNVYRHFKACPLGKEETFEALFDDIEAMRAYYKKSFDKMRE